MSRICLLRLYSVKIDYFCLIFLETLHKSMLKVGPIIIVDSFFRASVLGKALGLTAQAVISHCLTGKHLLIMTAPKCLWAYLKDLGNDQGGQFPTEKIVSATLLICT